MIKMTFALAAVSLSMLAGCSSKGNGNSGCSSVAPCGGNAVGTWTVTAECVNVSEVMTESCGSLTVNGSETNASGTLTINADGTYSSTTSDSTQATLTVPAACLSATVTCTTISQAIPASDGTWTCSGGAGGGCTCNASSSGSPSSETGTYLISGNNVTTTPTPTSTGTSKQYSYCVSGNTLTLIPQGGAGETVTGSLVFTKQ